jgi:Fe2+ transport system protein FeoA
LQTLATLRQGETATLDHLDLPEALAHRLMQLGFIPGVLIEAAHQAPGGDPRVYRVDGSEIALRQETARRLFCR